MRLLQNIQEATKRLVAARESGDEDAILDIEDELFELEDMLEAVQEDEYNEKHQHGWN